MRNIFRLNAGAGTNAVPDDFNAATNGMGTGGTVNLDFDSVYLFADDQGVLRESPLEQVLAHEMKHLADFDKGTADTSPDPQRPKQMVADTKAMEEESKVRSEMMLPGARTDYGKSQKIHTPTEQAKPTR